ncbi:hypothetical protein HOA69_01635, partial [Candidatus Woesearchaeota archaeon]|nr:hypothetical protein [Candidatus Woesearchaeota archaeon]
LIRPKGEELIVDSNGNIDLGYTTVRLKRQPIEDKVPEEIIIDVAAKIYFDVESGFGMLSTQSFNLVAQPNEEAWLKSLADSTLWGGKGYIRVLDINANTARVQVYDANKRKTGISNIVKLIEGAEPKEIMLPGAPSMLENRINIKLERVSNNENSATLLIQEEIGNETLSTTKTYVKGMKLNSEWSVKQIYSEGIVLMNSDFDEVYLKYGGASEVVNPCGNFSPLEIDELTNATSTQLYCQAIEEYRSALSLSQTSGDKALFNLYIGNTYLKLNSWEKAAKYFQKCIDVGSPSEANTCKGNLATTKEIAKDNYNSIPIDNSLVVLKEINTGSKQNSIMYQTLENYGDPINTLVSGTINDYLSNETLEDEMGNRYKWIIKSINAEEVVIEQEFTWTVNRALPTEKTRTLELGKKIQVPFGTQNKFIYIDKINISESAVITVSPGTRDNYGTSHFQIHLPIEKRLWQWTPEEIDNMIESTDKTLNKLDGIIENLGNIISTWKGVCFATFATLTVKNAFFSNPARRMIETRFRADCKSNTSNEEAAIDCFKNKESEIDNLVKTSKTEEEELKNAFKDADFSDEESLKKIASKLDGINETELVNLNKYQGITGQDLYTSMYETAVFNNTKLDIKQEVATANKIGKAVNKEIDNKPVSEKERAEIERKYILNMGEGNAEKSSDALFANQDERAKEVLGEVNIITTNDGNPLQVYTKEDGTKYIINAEGEQVTVTPIMDGGKVLSSSKGDFYNSTDKTYLAGLAQGALSTNYGTVPRIYFDKDTKKPVLIPFQLKNNKDKKLGYANYIYVDEEEGRQGGYKFSIWNPGPDRLPNTKDDKGIKYSSQLHPDKRLKENEDLAREVERTYQQAVSLAGKKDGTTVEFNGIKVILQKEYQGNIGKSLNSDGVCTDSMSELDCKILFNVCDPVMCPPSRFNFGGKWDMGAQVGSVVQKGIVGSLVLGWGNGDILPICLTGIHAGLENIPSMFGGFR